MFLLGTSQKTLYIKTAVFATRSQKNRKYRGFGLPRRKKHRYLRRFLPREINVKKNAKTPPIWRFSATTRLRKNCRGNNNNNNKHTNATKRCMVRWLQAAVWKEHHTVLCTCAHVQSTWTTPTLTQLYRTLIASPVCEALQVYRYTYIYIYIHINNTLNTTYGPWGFILDPKPLI